MDFERGFILANTEALHLFPRREERQHCAGLENANTVISTVPIALPPQTAVTYVRNAVPEGYGTQNLQTLGLAGQSAHIALISVGSGKQRDAGNAPTTIALFDQGLVQVLQAATGVQPKQAYVLGIAVLSERKLRMLNDPGPLSDGERWFYLLTPGLPAGTCIPARIEVADDCQENAPFEDI